MFLVPLYGAQTVIAVLHLPYLPCAPVWCPNCHCWLHLPFVPCAPAPSTICSLCPNCHCCAPSTICSLCPCMVSKLSLLCSIYHMFLVPLVWCPNCHCCAPSTICSLCPLYGAQTVPVLHLPYVPCAQTVIAVLHLPYVPCAPVWCPNCHCCAPSTICSLCPCMVSKLSLLCSIYHMFLVPLYGVQTVIAVLHLPYVPVPLYGVQPVLCSIYHMFLVPLYGVQTVIAVLHLPYVPCAPVWCPNCHCCAPSTICSCAPVWCPNCHCCAPSTICSLCPCMVPKLSLLCSIYHMFLVPLYGAQTYVPCALCMVSLLCSIYHMFLVPLYGVQTVIAVLHLPYVPCAPVWCPNCH